MSRVLRFVSKNEHKLSEATEILAWTGVNVIPMKTPIVELQTDDTMALVRDKTLKAFRHTGRPLFVEHTGLYLHYLNGLPGGLTQTFWDRMEADLFASRFGTVADRVVEARTVIGYTDGFKVHIFEGAVTGTVASEPRGPKDFQWDCVFIPDGYNQTFAELGSEIKNRISMRRVALDAFAKYLSTEGSEKR
jgi:XTP/dITP diphosphohydrolase